MADNPDLEKLAKTYLDLWQRQMSGMMNDPEAAKWMTEAASKNLEMSQQIGKAWSEAFSAAMDEHGVAPPTETAQHTTKCRTQKDDDDGDQSERAHRTAGAEAADAASGDDDQRLGDLERRLAAVEERLVALEGGAKKQRGRALKKS